MAVSALNWKYVGNTTLGGSGIDIDDMLDELYNLLNSSTYYDGSSRTPGSGVAWSPTKYVDTVTKAVYCEPSSAASSTCQGMRIIFAGEDTGASSNFPLYNLSSGPALGETGSESASHNWLQACLFGGLAKNAGSFTNHTPGASTTPFTSGGFSGFMRIMQKSKFDASRIFLYESLDAIWVAIQDGSSGDGRMEYFSAGGLYDPGSASAVDSEADEVVYGVIASGNHRSGADLDFNSNIQQHPNWRGGTNFTANLSFSVGTAAYTMNPAHFFNYSASNKQGSGGTPVGVFLRSDKRMLLPLHASEYYPTSGAKHMIGRLREVFYAGRVLTGQKLTGGGSDLGYYVGQHGIGSSTTKTGIMLKA